MLAGSADVIGGGSFRASARRGRLARQGNVRDRAETVPMRRLAATSTDAVDHPDT
jgi:hypothetical protein